MVEHYGLQHWNFTAPELIEEAIRRREGRLTTMGAFAARTGKRTGRSPKDKFIVRDGTSEPHVNWGDTNAAFAPEKYDVLERRVLKYLSERDLFVEDLYACAKEEHRRRVRVVTEYAWHGLFVRCMFIRPAAAELGEFQPDWTVVCAPNFLADPARDGTNSETFIILNFTKKRALIGGTQYAGEMKKSIFSVLNYELPLQGIMSMHCSANIGERGDVALFFGLSGTGKTTLSADPHRRLIGDDEHGWSREGVFNFEGGCYAKAINLSPHNEPQIYKALRFGAVLENVVIDPLTQQIRFEDSSITENTRAAYPLQHIDGAVEPSVGGHPSNVVFLTCDAFGVLPPISRLTPEQAMFHFLSGYTAKVAGTEAGMGNEPQATFSTCFGAPFMTLRPDVYADLLGKKIHEHKARVWLLNTGWSGGGVGVGSRMKLPHTRAMVTAALSGALDNVPTDQHAIFGVSMPRQCPEVPAEVLNPRTTWSDTAAYDAKAKELAKRFLTNFEKFPSASETIRSAGPKV
jgi:phosphoenolpyruvate carboxykinase (ATP)